MDLQGPFGSGDEAEDAERFDRDDVELEDAGHADEGTDEEHFLHQEAQELQQRHLLRAHSVSG